MIGFKQLREATTNNVYQYYSARSNKKNKFYVIDTGDDGRDIVVSFTSETDNKELSNHSKKAWFCTVSALKNVNGGVVIKNIKNEEAIINTLAIIINDFTLTTGALSILMRIKKKGDGRVFDMKLKKALLAYRLKSDSTKSMGGKVSNMYTFFALGRKQPDIDLESITTTMAREIDPSTKRAIIITADMDAGFSAIDSDVTAQWVDDNPESAVVDKLILPESKVDFIANKSLIESNNNHNQFYEAARAVIDINLGPVDMAKHMSQYMAEADKSVQSVDMIVKTLSERSREQYKALSSVLDETRYVELSSDEKMFIKRFLKEGYATANKTLTTGMIGGEKMVEAMDSMFSMVGAKLDGGYLYRGMVMDKDEVNAIINEEVYATTAFLRATSDIANIVEMVGVPNDLDFNDKVFVSFVIDAADVPVLVAGSNGSLSECEFVINRNTQFNASLIQRSSNSVVIRLSHRSVTFKESVSGLLENKTKTNEMKPLASLLALSKIRGNDSILSKHNRL